MTHFPLCYGNTWSEDQPRRQDGVTVSVTVKGEKGLFLTTSWVRRCCIFNDLACRKLLRSVS